MPDPACYAPPTVVLYRLEDHIGTLRRPLIDLIDACIAATLLFLEVE